MVSTKALFELIRRVEGTTLQSETEALRELSAIERAAFILIMEDVIPPPSSVQSEDVQAAIRLFRKVANVEMWGRA